MLLPAKHVTLGDSLLGLGAVVLELLDRPRTLDQLHGRISAMRATPALPAYHDFDNLMLAMLFLYAVGSVELSDHGMVQRCES